jgi:hypothetical protein
LIQARTGNRDSEMLFINPQIRKSASNLKQINNFLIEIAPR